MLQGRAEAERAGGRRRRRRGARCASDAPDRGTQLEDRAADVPDGRVEVVDGRVDPLGHLRSAGVRHGALQLHAGGEQPLDDHVVQVPGDPLAVLQHHQQLAFLLGAGAFQGERGLAGEAGQQRRVVVAGCRRPAWWPTTSTPCRASRAAQRGDHGRAVRHRRRPVGGGPQVVDQDPVLALHGIDELGRGARQECADQPRWAGVRAVDRLDGEPVGVLVVEQHQDQLGLGDLAGAAGDQLQRLGAADLARAARR